MKGIKLIASALIATTGFSAGAAGESAGQLTIQVPEDFGTDKIVVRHNLLDDMIAGRRDTLVTDTLTLQDGRAVLSLDPAGASYYFFSTDGETRIPVFAKPGENISVDISVVSPVAYGITGTPLMEGISEYNSIIAPLEGEYARLVSSGQPSEEAMSSLMSRYDAVTNSFIDSHIDSPAIAYVLLNAQGEEFIALYDRIGPEARKSILMPMVDAMRPAQLKVAESERFQKSLLSGNVDAPSFTFSDLEGNPVSLSDFKGQWVVLDFWGSWCGWCIKGFPKLKEVYREANGKFQVIGIDCRDSEAAWRAAVAKYELPWVNVYNSNPDSPVLSAYGVTGFPTKAIVSPEGKLVDITVGEDPAFYDKLAGFINQ